MAGWPMGRGRTTSRNDANLPLGGPLAGEAPTPPCTCTRGEKSATPGHASTGGPNKSMATCD
eukprot:3814623-Lingulodinium_polyedra.AAC.1